MIVKRPDLSTPQARALDRRQLRQCLLPLGASVCSTCHEIKGIQHVVSKGVGKISSGCLLCHA